MQLEQIHIVLVAVSTALGAIVTLIGAIWKVSHVEQNIREDFRNSIGDVNAKIQAVELAAEQKFLQRNAFDEFRREFREDMRALMERIDLLAERNERVDRR